MTAKDKVINQSSGMAWHLYNADCIDGIKGIPSCSIGMTLFSPPYQSLYVYSNSTRDMGNCRDDNEFYKHFEFLIGELFRVTMPGRVVAIDCQNVPAMKGKDGYIGIKDFRGDLIRMLTGAGFFFHSEHVIWKDPLIEATRTKTVGLLHKQLCKDSAMSRAGLPQYLLAFRKPGDNPRPIKHPLGVDFFIGDEPPTGGNLSHERWRRYASPVWMDIRSTRTLNYREARDDQDEKHVCPMALDIIERALWLWSGEGDAVLDPFSGIGSTGYCAVRFGRKAIGFELKPSYYNIAVKNLRVAERKFNQQSRTLFDPEELDEPANV